MHVPWGWIKQRPHFLAEQLSDDYEVSVVIPKSFRVPNLTVNNTKMNIRSIIKFPFERFKIVRLVNTIIVQFLFKYIYLILNKIWNTIIIMKTYKKS